MDPDDVEIEQTDDGKLLASFPDGSAGILDEFGNLWMEWPDGLSTMQTSDGRTFYEARDGWRERPS
jgi:hypothetical protein